MSTINYVTVMVYGQFRSYKLNINNNLQLLYDIFDSNTNFLFFILSDKEEKGNYSQFNENNIKQIIENNPNNKIAYFNYIENISDCLKKEDLINSQFYKTIKYSYGTENNTFMGTLLYRKYLLNKIKNNFLKDNNIQTEYQVFLRLFDINIEKIGNYNFFKHIDDKSIVGSLDTIFIGKKESIDFLFNISKLIKYGFVYHDYIWKNKNFTESVEKVDYNFYSNKITYCPEMQYLCHMYFNGYLFYNIRFDYTNPKKIEKYINEVYDIKLCPDRFKCT